MADIQIFDLTSNPGLAKIKRGPAFIQKGSFRHIHVIPIDNFDNIIENIEEVLEKVDRDDQFYNLLKNKISILKQVLSNLTPNHRSKRSWEGLGSAIKWIAGNPDAHDLRKIDSKFKDLKTTNDEQFEINDIFEDRLNNLTKIMATSIEGTLNRTLNSFETVNLILNVDMIIQKLENINEAIILAKTRIVSKNILENRELQSIFYKLKNQNVSLTSWHQMFEYLEVELSYDEKNILYNVIIPQLEGNFERIHVEPLPNGNKQVKLSFEEILMKENKTLAINHRCIELKTNTICKAENVRDISDDGCIPYLCRNKEGKCIFEDVTEKTTTRVITSGTVIIKNAIQIILYNTCGIGNHTMTGTFVINFRNCSLILEDERYDNLEERISEHPEVLPLYNVKITQASEKHLVDLHELQDLHLQHKKRIEEINANQEIFGYVTAGTFIVISALFLIIVVTMMIKTFRSKRDVLKLKREELPLEPLKEQIPITHTPLSALTRQ